jgi:hypothetical protein
MIGADRERADAEAKSVVGIIAVLAAIAAVIIAAN